MHLGPTGGGNHKKSHKCCPSWVPSWVCRHRRLTPTSYRPPTPAPSAACSRNSGLLHCVSPAEPPAPYCRGHLQLWFVHTPGSTEPAINTSLIYLWIQCLDNRSFIFSRFWRLEVQVQSVGRLVSSEASPWLLLCFHGVSPLHEPVSQFLLLLFNMKSSPAGSGPS